LAILVMMADTAGSAQPADRTPLQLEAKIALGNVRGRIDHMAVDLKRQRLFVAELANDSVGVVDLANRSLIRTIDGLHEPQGVGYDPRTDTVFVANARDGSVRLFDGNDYKATGQLDLGSDADNIRIDSERVVIGYGDGALAFFDPATRSRVLNASLKVHPESFQIDPQTNRVLVNLPNAHAVGVVDGKSGKQIANWPMDKGGNFAMTIDHNRSQLLVAFRNPAQLAVLALADGKPVVTVETCGDVDDLFTDAKRARVYVSCGTGFVDVFDTNDTIYRHLARIPTAAGARTSLFLPEMDRLLIAVRAGPAGPAAVWMFKPVP
jgi:DNA-binding beta-propeller fold protein YncE